MMKADNIGRIRERRRTRMKIKSARTSKATMIRVPDCQGGELILL
jgi:hypothetical protein